LFFRIGDKSNGNRENLGFNLLLHTASCALYFILIKTTFKNYKVTITGRLFIWSCVSKISAPGESPVPPKGISNWLKLDWYTNKLQQSITVAIFLSYTKFAKARIPTIPIPISLGSKISWQKKLYLYLGSYLCVPVAVDKIRLSHYYIHQVFLKGNMLLWLISLTF